MARWIGLAVDPVAGGSDYDTLNTPGPVAVLNPTVWVPATTANVDAGISNLERNDEVRVGRGNTAPSSFASAPSLSFETRAYPAIVKPVIRRAFSGGITTTGTAPAAVTSKVAPLAGDPLLAFQAKVLRETQLDELAGLIIDQFTLDFPADGDGTLSAQGQALYHNVPAAVPGGLPTPAFTSGYGDTYKLRDLKAYTGAGAGTLIPCLGGFSMTFDNNMVDDFTSRFCAGENVRGITVGSNTYKLWYPGQHKVGPQQVTGQIRFGNARPDFDLRRILAIAEKLVVEVTAGPITPATTPAADELLRLTLYSLAPTGGGAEALTREGDINSTYDFTAYVDSTGKDIEAEFVSAAALAA